MSVARVTILAYMSAEPADEFDLAYWEIFCKLCQKPMR